MKFSWMMVLLRPAMAKEIAIIKDPKLKEKQNKGQTTDQSNFYYGE